MLWRIARLLKENVSPDYRAKCCIRSAHYRWINLKLDGITCVESEGKDVTVNWQPETTWPAIEPVSKVGRNVLQHSNRKCSQRNSMFPAETWTLPLDFVWISYRYSEEPGMPQSVVHRCPTCLAPAETPLATTGRGTRCQEAGHRGSCRGSPQW